MDLRSQKMIAARIMKCGETRVWMDPTRSADISDAITAGDVRKLINDGVVKAIPKKGNSSFRKNKIRAQKKKGRRLGTGSRKGKIKTRIPRKQTWMKKIRALRKLMIQLRTEGRVDGKTYRDIYIKSKSGFFRSKSHIMIYLERNKLLKEKEGK